MSSIFSSENLRKFVSYYPKELAIEIKDGIISTNNISEPYFIKETFDSTVSKENKYENFVVIDTQSDFSADIFNSYNTRVLIGKNFIVTTEQPGQFEFNDASRVPDFSLDKEKILHWINLINKYHLGLSLLLFFGIFLSFFWFFTLTLISLVVVALVIKLLAKLRKVELAYINSYIIALYAITIPLILKTIFIFSGVMAPFPFFFSLIAIIIAVTNLQAKN